MENFRHLDTKSFAAERQMVSPERAELLELITRLEDDTDSPIAIGEIVKVRRGDAERTVEDGWTVYGYDISEDNTTGKPQVVALVKKQGLEKHILIGSLRMLNPTVN